MPFPLRDGGAISIHNTALGLMNQNVDVKIVAINTPRNPVDSAIIPDKFKKRTGFEFVIVDTRVNYADAFINLFSSDSYFVTRFFSKDFENRLIKLLKETKFDIVLLEHVYMGLYIKTIRTHSRSVIILRPQNVESQVWMRYAEGVLNPVKRKYLKIITERLMKFEKDVTSSVDGIIAISPGDALTFKKWAPEVPVETIPVGIDFRRYEKYDFNRQYEKFPVFYHLGSMDWLPNYQGVEWFVNKVVPFVREVYPEFSFRIAGKNMSFKFKQWQNESLIVDGEVEDPIEYQSDKAVMIVPLLSGSGIRVKIIEGMAIGKTIISTSIGAEGIPYKNGVNILIADSKEEFLEKILQCANSQEFCRKTGKNASLLAMENFDINKTAGEMIRFFKSVS